MASLDSVRQKMYRAKHHFEELKAELLAYYGSNPGDLVETEGSTPKVRQYVFRERQPVPTRLPLIFGDCIQCLRSSLDYLVWELAEAAGKEPHKKLMFPIAMTEAAFKNDVARRGRLDGVDPNAIAIIDKFQPYLSTEPKQSILAIFDELTNINKHRRVVLTRLAGSGGDLPLPFPHIIGVVKNVTAEGGVISETAHRGFICIDDGFAKDIEITNCLDTIARYIGEEMLPRFEVFFS
jgi:hypothetical protein